VTRINSVSKVDQLVDIHKRRKYEREQSVACRPRRISVLAGGKDPPQSITAQALWSAESASMRSLNKNVMLYPVVHEGTSLAFVALAMVEFCAVHRYL
jgi:hypothetical protein